MDDNNIKLNNNIFNILTTLGKCINLTAIIKEGKDGLYFQIINLVAGHTKKKLWVLLNLSSFIGEEN